MNCPFCPGTTDLDVESFILDHWNCILMWNWFTKSRQLPDDSVGMI